MKTHALKFDYLRYNVIDIVTMIDNNPTTVDFVFTFYSPDADGHLQLAANARMIVGPNEVQYSELMDILKPYRSQALEVCGPVILSNNFISIADMKALIGFSNGQSNNITGFLVFVPDLLASNHVFYNVTAYTLVNNITTVAGTGTVTTDPSPPATMPS